AAFPWRTINGEEASAFYAAGTAQFHINADIAFALSKYVSASGDEDFMMREGIDVLVETARMWADLGFWLGRKEPKFHIHGVTGPDEYTTVVNNNLFTNVMARDNLRQAARWSTILRERRPLEFARLVARLEIEDAEIQEWARCAEGMHIPYDEAMGVHPQDQHFLEREVWDLAATPADKRPLLLHYHPLVIYRFQVLKQADVVAALFLQGDLFTVEEKRADFEYYDPITTGDSTLSAVVQSIIAAEVGYQDLALRYFHDGLYVDLADLHRNAAEGVHIASCGGVWNSAVYGFGGMRDHNGTLTFDPRLPASWPRLEFRIRVRGSRVRVEVLPDQISFTVVEGEGREFVVRGERVRVEAGADGAPGEPTVVALADQGPLITRVLGSMPVVGRGNEHDMVYTAGVPDPRSRTSAAQAGSRSGA
ncbi:MAG: glycosyl hydrolase family 65 protein, partial [Pedococcus sp.]